MWTRAELKERAKTAFKSNYWKSVIAGLVMAFTAGGVGGSVRTGGQAVGTAGGSTTIDIQNIDPRVVAMICAILATIAAGAFLVKLFLLNPLSVGASRFFVKNSERPDASLNVPEGSVSVFLGVSLHYPCHREVLFLHDGAVHSGGASGNIRNRRDQSFPPHDGRREVESLRPGPVVSRMGAGLRHHLHGGRRSVDKPVYLRDERGALPDSEA